MNRSEKRRPRARQAGFAMVATLSMMVLLTVVVVGMLSLSTVTLRKSAVENPRLVAQANARLALMMAIGELQKNLGPDQRVSGDERMVTRGSGTPANPHWLSVWKTTREDGTPWIVRNGEKGGLADLRKDSGYDLDRDRTAVLVSGNEGEIHYRGTDPLDEKESALLVGTGSLGEEADPKDEVRAPLVKVENQEQNRGSYAWWVGDLGARANVATRDATVSLSASKYHAQTLSQDASWKAFGADDIPDSVRPALVNEPQLEHFEKDFKDRHFHDFTVWSAGLPVNVRDGGWRRDLSAYLDSEGDIPALTESGAQLPGISDQDALVGPANAMEDNLSANPGQAKRFSRVAPRFGLLRKWAERSETASFGSYRTANEVGDLVALSTGGGNSKSVDIQKRTKSHLMPVLVEGSMFYNLSYYTPPTPPQPGNPHALRVHFYPRVVLWNPFNFPIQVPNSGIFMHINGAKSVEVTLRDGRKQTFRMYWGRGDGKTGGSVRGSMFFRMDAATIEPGESMVWSPATNTPYNESNFGQNRLSPSIGPSPLRAFYQDKRADNWPLFEIKFPGGVALPGQYSNVTPAVPVDWREMVPVRPGGNIQDKAWTQADDYFMSWKPLPSTSFDASDFSNAPMGRFISCAYQYGDEDEMPVEWTSVDPVPFAMTTVSNTSMSQLPDRRTRDGFRLRWFNETESNRIGSGSLAGTPYLEESAIGNWNMRASWAFRNPFENVSDVAPNFFGIYTRDLFDGEVDWSNMAPKAAGGKFLGDPFDQPSHGPQKRILFDVPRAGAELSSVGAFQHVGFSEFIWHPTYPLGNSLADPRVPIAHTEPDRSEKINRDKGGWNQDSIGYSTDGRSGNDNGATTDADNWAWSARNYYQQAALDQTLVYDLSYELNHTLWDGYFLSSGTNAQKGAFLADREASPLPNGRMKPNPMAGQIQPKDLTDFHKAGSKLLIDGAFNVNSTSVAAWEALLLSGVDGVHGDKVAFPRFLETPSGDWNGNDAKSSQAWAGQRVFTREEIRKLAEEIVREVEARGPFLSLGDFVNRRLEAGEHGKKGALQAAIDRAGLNAPFTEAWPLDNRQSLSDFRHVDHIVDPTRMEQTLKPDTTAWGGLGFLTQADVLQYIGSALSARSDTFRIRAYGEAVDKQGKVISKAWCEAVVQRSPNYVDGGDNALKGPANLNVINAKFGRRFEVVFFRWLQPSEI